MTGKKEPEEICRELLKAYPDMEVVLTLGSQGVLYQSAEKKCFQKAFKVDAVDTTGAGDTFTGYFLRCVSEGETPEKALRLASKAASIAVSRAGAPFPFLIGVKLFGKKSRADKLPIDADGKSCPEKGDDGYFRELFKLRQPGDDTVVVRCPTATVL